MATKKPRYMISVSNEMFEQIEDFRFNNRFQTRSEATTELLRLGIEVLKKRQEEAEAQEAEKAEKSEKAENS